MKHKAYKSEVLDIAEKGIVTISISKFGNEDMGGDVVHKGAFEKTFKEMGSRIRHVVDHNIRYSGTIGLPKKMWEGDTHAIVESALNLEKEISRDVFSDYKFFKDNGRTLEHSFGYETIRGKARQRGEDIFELKMYEYSTVGLGMNPETGLIDIKSMDVDDIAALEAYLRKFDVSNTKGKQIEQIIAQIKALKTPENSTSSNGAPENTTHQPGQIAQKMNELLNTKNIFQ